MHQSKAGIDRDLSPAARYLKQREEAFAEFLSIFKDVIFKKTIFFDFLTAAVNRYSQFLDITRRQPLIEAVNNFDACRQDHTLKYENWAMILSFVMSSGVNHCGIKSPGITEAQRLIVFSPFKNKEIIAHVTMFGITSPNEVLKPMSYHNDYQKARRMIYQTMEMDCVDLCMGAEYFVACNPIRTPGRPVRWEANSSEVWQVVRPIDERDR